MILLLYSYSRISSIKTLHLLSNGYKNWVPVERVRNKTEEQLANFLRNATPEQREQVWIMNYLSYWYRFVS